MSVSKIIPTIGKRPECVMETIESLIAQTVNPVEISIVMSGFSEHEVIVPINFSLVTIKSSLILSVPIFRNLRAFNSNYDFQLFCVLITGIQVI